MSDQTNGIVLQEKSSLVTGKVSGGLIPRNMDELLRLSEIMASSGLMPKGCEKSEQVFVAIEMGLEVGLSPMQAVQNIAVINGKPSIYGDAASALILASGLVALHVETEIVDEQTGEIIGWEVYGQRVGGRESRHRFTIEDAKRANLWDNPNKSPWIQYPQRMLLWRARSWVFRDLYADVLKGLRIAEEAVDMPPIEVGEIPERAPIVMPTAKQPATQPAPSAKRQPPQKEHEPSAPAPEEPGPEEVQEAEGESWSVKVKITSMNSKKAPDGAWVKWGLKCSDGKWYNTFNQDFADLASTAKEAGAQAQIKYKETKYGREILDFTVEGL